MNNLEKIILEFMDKFHDMFSHLESCLGISERERFKEELSELLRNVGIPDKLTK